MMLRSSMLVVSLGFLAAGCGGSPPPKATTATTSAEAARPSETVSRPPTEGPTMCDLVCEQAKVVARPADDPDYTARATENANRVLGEMHDDFIACYKHRLAVKPNAYGFIAVDIVIGPDGSVRNVDSTGGAILGPATMKCIVDRISLGKFEPPHGGGTLHIQVPFSLHPMATDDTY